jgi:hypothetical protein
MLLMLLLQPDSARFRGSAHAAGAGAAALDAAC